MKTQIPFELYQNKLIEILKFFDDFCRKNDIKYTVLDGTLLGAVRHKGMIPWDGDVDVAVTPKEFAKLQKLFDSKSGKYHLDYLPNHIYRKRGRKHDFPTITAKIVDKTCSSSIFGIDVFTIDFLGDNLEYAQETLKLYLRYYKLIRYIVSAHIPEVKGYKRYFSIVLFPFMYILSKITSPFIIKKYLDFRKNRIDCNSETCKYYTIEPYINRIGIEENKILDEGYMDLDFEDFKVMAVRNYNSYLKPTYGDYMKLPPLDKREPYPSKNILENVQFEE